MFLPKPDGQTDRHTDGRTDIRIYRVASLRNIRNIFIAPVGFLTQWDPFLIRDTIQMRL